MGTGKIEWFSGTRRKVHFEIIGGIIRFLHPLQWHQSSACFQQNNGPGWKAIDCGPPDLSVIGNLHELPEPSSG